MGIQQRNLKMIFREIQPETLFESIRRAEAWGTQGPEISSSRVGPAVFQQVARTQYPSYSHEEIANIHRLMAEKMQAPPDREGAGPSVFYLLVHMGRRLLRQVGEGVACDFSETMAWRNVSLALGQDLFTTAFLAYEDMVQGLPPRRELAWGAAIRTDNHRLHGLLREGLAENHCHLGGTTQAFPLSWACLMNFPGSHAPAEQMLDANLNPQLSRGPGSNVWPWRKRLLWAQHLRLELFRRLEGQRDGRMDLEEDFYWGRSVRNRLRAVRFSYGARIPQPKGPPLVLDYALRQQDCGGGLLKNHNRLLSGERNFLYRCFRACFEGRFTQDEQDWFYLYLLIKENFRGEIVQTNSQTGFYNFMKYQDRKDTVYDGVSGYWPEALRLAVNANQQGQHITSFELRVAPKKTPRELCSRLEENERLINYAWRDSKTGRQEGRHFYVYHFIKFPDPDRDDPIGRPRNSKVRRDCRRQAKAMASALLRPGKFCELVYGIDAANLEIGCRPETFAVEFRFLRGIAPARQRDSILERYAVPHIKATYHAGEDFLDIADGLRAIDEAIRFFEMRRGDRIAHALALGVDPEIHYRYKLRRVLLPKQDFLDNIIWLLFRSGELNLEIRPQLRSQLEAWADRLFFEIYDGGNSLNRYQYYCAMQLRGDAPELYYTLPYNPRERITGSTRNRWEAYRVRLSGKLEAYRTSEAILRLMQSYHFDPQCRARGRALVEYEITEDYVCLMRQMQDALAWDCARQGIMIECNPTSNYLIGTFRRYDNHPIFRFNNARLVESGGGGAATPQLSVSVNTDDLGVFDTTLENEYAILASCLERAKDGEGRPKYTRDSIYQYLDNARRMGLEQSFLTNH